MRIIFYGLFAAYQLAGFIFTIAIDRNTSMLFSMAGHVSTFKYLSFIGVLLLTIDIIWSLRQSGKTRKEVEEFKQENNTLKAKIYDFQETRKEVRSAASK